MRAVVASEERAMPPPNRPPEPTSSLGMIFEPCWVQVDPDRLNSHAPPRSLFSVAPPISAVLPSEETAVDSPKRRPSEPRMGSLGVSFGPCWVHTPPTRVKTQNAPAPLLPTGRLSLGPPMTAVLPSEERAVAKPKAPSPISSLPVSFGPCCVHVDPERVNTHTAPAALSNGPPITAVLPSEESATSWPKRAAPLSPLPVSFGPCCVQVEPERVKTHAAPMPPLSPPPPTSAVLPSAESATPPSPNSPAPSSSLPPVSLGPCCDQLEPERVKTHTAPMPPLSSLPTSAVLPSEDKATLTPKRPPSPALTSSLPPVSLGPCWVQLEPERVNTQTAPVPLLSSMPPISAVLPSEESATEKPKRAPPTSSAPVSLAC